MIVFIFYIIYVKLFFYVHVCNFYLTSFTYCFLKFINMILMINILKKNLTILKNVYDIFLDEIHFFWINRDFLTLIKKIQKRKIFIIRLKIAKISFIISITKSFRQHKNHEFALSSEINIEKKSRDHMYISRQINAHLSLKSFLS